MISTNAAVPVMVVPVDERTIASLLGIISP
jgi:hypothetical protein